MNTRANDLESLVRQDGGPARRGSPSRSRSIGSATSTCIVVVVVSLVLGGLTSVGQTVLPDGLDILANSSTGWTLVTAAVVCVAHRTARLSALLGMLSFVALPFGYAVVSTWRGFFFDPDFWAAIGVVVGPVVGLAASGLGARGRRLAVSGGVLAGIALGEALHGLIRLLDDVGPASVLVLTGLAALLLGWLIARLRSVRGTALALVTSATAAVGLFGAYGLLNRLSSGA